MLYKVNIALVISSPDLDLAEEYVKLFVDAEREINSNIKSFDVVVVRSLTEDEERRINENLH